MGVEKIKKETIYFRIILSGLQPVRNLGDIVNEPFKNPAGIKRDAEKFGMEYKNK